MLQVMYSSHRRRWIMAQSGRLPAAKLNFTIYVIWCPSPDVHTYICKWTYYAIEIFICGIWIHCTHYTLNVPPTTHWRGAKKNSSNKNKSENKQETQNIVAWINHCTRLRLDRSQHWRHFIIREIINSAFFASDIRQLLDGMLAELKDIMLADYWQAKVSQKDILLRLILF